MTDLDLDFVFSENRYKIKQNEKFERFLHSIVLKDLSNYWKYLLTIKVGDKLYGYDHPKIHTADELKSKFTEYRETPHFYLRDNKIEFKIEEYSGELPDVNKYKIHPKFLQYVATKLEQELYYNSVRKSTFERYNQLANA